MDAIRLEVMWNRLISVVNEQAAALMRTSFTSIVREAGDLSAGVFDARGNMIAQAVTGTPGPHQCNGHLHSSLPGGLSSRRHCGREMSSSRTIRRRRPDTCTTSP